MTNALEIAENNLLTKRGLGLSDVQNTLDSVMLISIDQADLYFQSSHSESWVLEDGIVREGSYNIDQGVGVRAISGEKTGFAYSDEIVLPALTQAASAARSIASHGSNGQLQAWKKSSSSLLYNDHDPINSISTEDKINLLKQMDQAARKKDPRVKQVMIGLTGSQTTVLVANSEGTLSADVRPLVRLNVNVIVEEDGRIEKGGAGGGGRFGYDYFLKNGMGMHYVGEAIEQALINLNADAAPAGAMPVVLGPGWPGILLHEAIGHGLEGDFNRKKTSAFSDRIGERVASPEVTVVDDGTIENRRGSLNVDDEGTPTSSTTLIERGILKGLFTRQAQRTADGCRPHREWPT